MKINFRKIIIIGAIAICFIAIILIICFQTTKNKKRPEIKEEIIEINTGELEQNFNNIFDNILDYQGNNVYITKIDATKELVYSNYTNQNKKDGMYELNINIPYINIDNEEAKKINEEIDNIFYKKVSNILVQSTINTIYSVNYKAYINENILSLIINGNLKEGDNIQRRIIKTYNYNLSSNNKLDIKQILEYRKVFTDKLQEKIYAIVQNKISNQNNNYVRNINDEIYKVNNTTTYFLGKNKSLYILYSYGNLSNTSEIDLLVI